MKFCTLFNICLFLPGQSLLIVATPNTKMEKQFKVHYNFKKVSKLKHLSSQCVFNEVNEVSGASRNNYASKACNIKLIIQITRKSGVQLSPKSLIACLHSPRFPSHSQNRVWCHRRRQHNTETTQFLVPLLPQPHHVNAGVFFTCTVSQTHRPPRWFLFSCDRSQRLGCSSNRANSGCRTAQALFFPPKKDLASKRTQLDTSWVWQLDKRYVQCFFSGK